MVFDTIGSAAYEWAGRTYPDIKEIGAAAGSIVIVPVGSLEQHGYHLPAITDTVLSTAVSHLGADRVADRVPILVTPPVWSGYSPHHLAHGGTITLSLDTLLAVLGDVAGSALENGFDALLFVNGHGGNMSIIRSAVREVGMAHAESAEIHGVTYFELAAPFIDDIRQSDPGGMAHAGEFETALMQYLRPDLVDEDEMTVHYRDRPYQDPWGRQDMFGDEDGRSMQGPLATYVRFDQESGSGVVGDPTKATPEAGEQIYAGLGDQLEQLLLEIHAHAA